MSRSFIRAERESHHLRQRTVAEVAFRKQDRIGAGVRTRAVDDENWQLDR